MSHVMKADLYRFRKSTALKVSFLISLISISTMALVLYLVSQGHIGKEIMGSLGLLTDAMMVSLLSSLVIGLIVCGDFNSKTIHSEIACGGRKMIVLAKTLTSMLITGIVLLPYAIVSVIVFATGADLAGMEGIPSLFIHIMTNQADVAIDGSSIGKAIMLCLVGIVVYMARLSICLPVAFIVRRPVAVMIVGIVSSFGFDMITKGLSDAPVLGDMLAYTPYAIIYDLNMDAGASTIFQAVSSSIVFIVLMTVITYFFFRKSDIK